MNKKNFYPFRLSVTICSIAARDLNIFFKLFDERKGQFTIKIDLKKQTLNKNKTKRPEPLNPAIRGCGVTTMLFGVFFLQVLNLVVKQDR